MVHRKDSRERGAARVLARGSPEVRARVAVLAGQVRELRAGATPGRAEPQPPRASAEPMIAAAERAAAEIRRSALREARRIREGSVAPVDEPAGLPTSARRQRHTAEVIAAEIERLEHSMAVLRTRLQSFEGELADMTENLSGPAA